MQLSKQGPTDMTVTTVVNIREMENKEWYLFFLNFLHLFFLKVIFGHSNFFYYPRLIDVEATSFPKLLTDLLVS